MVRAARKLISVSHYHHIKTVHFKNMLFSWFCCSNNNIHFIQIATNGQMRVIDMGRWGSARHTNNEIVYF